MIVFTTDFRYACITLVNICAHVPHARSPINDKIGNGVPERYGFIPFVSTFVRESTKQRPEHVYLHVLPTRFSGVFSLFLGVGTKELPISVFFSDVLGKNHVPHKSVHAPFVGY